MSNIVPDAHTSRGDKHILLEYMSSVRAACSNAQPCTISSCRAIPEGMYYEYIWQCKRWDEALSCCLSEISEAHRLTSVAKASCACANHCLAMPRTKTLAEELADLAHTAPAGIKTTRLCSAAVIPIRVGFKEN